MCEVRDYGCRRVMLMTCLFEERSVACASKNIVYNMHTYLMGSMSICVLVLFSHHRHHHRLDNLGQRFNFRLVSRFVTGCVFAYVFENRGLKRR